jgi:hypothetical protein
VLELQPILKQHSADELTGGDGEAAVMEGHERHHEPLRGTARTRRRGPSTRWRR